MSFTARRRLHCESSPVTWSVAVSWGKWRWAWNLIYINHNYTWWSRIFATGMWIRTTGFSYFNSDVDDVVCLWCCLYCISCLLMMMMCVPYWRILFTSYSQTNKHLKTLLTAILPLLGSFFVMTRNFIYTIFILFLPNKRGSSEESHRNNLFHCLIVIPLYLPLIVLFLFQVLHPTFITLPFLKKFFFNCPRCPV